MKVMTSRRQLDACLPMTRQKISFTGTKMGRKVGRATGDIAHRGFKVESSKVKVTRRINAGGRLSAISSERERVRTSNSVYTDGERRHASTGAMTSKLEALGSRGQGHIVAAALQQLHAART